MKKGQRKTVRFSWNQGKQKFWLQFLHSHNSQSSFDCHVNHAGATEWKNPNPTTRGRRVKFGAGF